MTIISDSLIYDLIIATVFLVGCIYYLLTAQFDYWKNRGVAFVKPIPLFGNLKDQFTKKKNQAEVYDDIYFKLKGNRFGGFFELWEPVLMIRDPALVEAVLIKDFRHFYDHPFKVDPKIDPLGASLFNLTGSVWKNTRNKLTPTFTTGKLKMMSEQIFNSGDKMIEHIAEESKKDKNVDSKSVTSCFSLEVIASVAFGIQMDKDSEASKNFRDLIPGLLTPSLAQSLKFFSTMYAPRVAQFLRLTMFPKVVEETIVPMIRDTLKYRTKNSVKRNDFLQLMLNIREGEVEGNKINHEQEEDDLIDQMKHVPKEAETDDNKVVFTDMNISAHSINFLLAGLEAVSSGINFGLLSLAQNPKIQDRLFEEIDQVMKSHNNVWSYQAVKEMVYLDEVVQESVRLYPQAPAIFRMCTEDYLIPDSDVVIKEGTRVIIPAHAIMNDPDNYDSPDVFDPSRFQDNFFKPNGRFIPFGDGPRVCIAMRFAILELKVGLARIISAFKVKPSNKLQLPITFEKTAFGPVPVGGFWFEFQKRN